MPRVRGRAHRPERGRVRAARAAVRRPHQTSPTRPSRPAACPGRSLSRSSRARRGTGLALLADNTGNPLASVQVRTSSGWLPLARASYNYWTPSLAPGRGPFTVRLTDTQGHQATVPGITLSPGVAQPTGTWMYGAGGGQPPATPTATPAVTPTAARTVTPPAAPDGHADRYARPLRRRPRRAATPAVTLTGAPRVASPDAASRTASRMPAYRSARAPVALGPACRCAGQDAAGSQVPSPADGLQVSPERAVPELSPTTPPTTIPLTSAYWPATAGAEDSGGIRETTIGSVLRDAAARAPGQDRADRRRPGAPPPVDLRRAARRRRAGRAGAAHQVHPGRAGRGLGAEQPRVGHPRVRRRARRADACHGQPGLPGGRARPRAR